MIDKELLEIIVCPKCHARVELREISIGSETQTRLVCTGSSCGLRYPIRDDIPVMLIEEADKAEAR